MCLQGYIVKHGVCVEHVPNCLIYGLDRKCAACLPSFMLQNGYCSQAIDHCLVHSISQSETGVCVVCENGFVLVNDTCVPPKCDCGIYNIDPACLECQVQEPTGACGDSSGSGCFGSPADGACASCADYMTDAVCSGRFESCRIRANSSQCARYVFPFGDGSESAPGTSTSTQANAPKRVCQTYQEPATVEFERCLRPVSEPGAGLRVIVGVQTGVIVVLVAFWVGSCCCRCKKRYLIKIKSNDAKDPTFGMSQINSVHHNGTPIQNDNGRCLNRRADMENDFDKEPVDDSIRFESSDLKRLISKDSNEFDSERDENSATDLRNPPSPNAVNSQSGGYWDESPLPAQKSDQSNVQIDFSDDGDASPEEPDQSGGKMIQSSKKSTVNSGLPNQQL